MKLTQTSPVQHWFISTQNTEFVQNAETWCWFKLYEMNYKKRMGWVKLYSIILISLMKQKIVYEF